MPAHFAEKWVKESESLDRRWDALVAEEERQAKIRACRDRIYAIKARIQQRKMERELREEKAALAARKKELARKEQAQAASARARQARSFGRLRL